MADWTARVLLGLRLPRTSFWASEGQPSPLLQKIAAQAHARGCGWATDANARTPSFFWLHHGSFCTESGLSIYDAAGGCLDRTEPKLPFLGRQILVAESEGHLAAHLGLFGVGRHSPEVEAALAKLGLTDPLEMVLVLEWAL